MRKALEGGGGLPGAPVLLSPARKFSYYTFTPNGPRLPAQEDLLPGFLSVWGGQARELGGLPLVLSQRCLPLCALIKGRG